MIFQNIQELKAHVGGAVNVNMPLQSLTAAYKAARRKHLERYLGVRFLDELEAAAATPPPDGLADAQEKAIEAVSEPLALLTLYEYTFTGSVQHGSEGLTRQESDTTRPAFKYQENDYRDWTLTTGLDALDHCLIFLLDHEDDYPTWRDGDGAEYHKAVLIRTAKTLRKFHNQPADRYAYEALRPILADVQSFVIDSLLGEEQMAELLGLRDAVSSLQKRLIVLLSRALAGFAVTEGLRRNLVQIQGGRIVQTEVMEPQGSVSKVSVQASEVNISVRQNEEFAERHLSKVRDFLNQNRSQFPLYQAWLDANQPDPETLYPATPDRRTGGKVVGL